MLQCEDRPVSSVGGRANGLGVRVEHIAGHSKGWKGAPCSPAALATPQRGEPLHLSAVAGWDILEPPK